MSNANKHSGKHARAGQADHGQTSRTTLEGAARRAVKGAEANPLLLVAGGVALGAAVGALLPRSERERSLLAPVGQRVGDALAAAIEAGRDAGRSELADSGISREAARDQVRSLFDNLVHAATTAGSAAAHAAANGGKTVG